MDKNKKNMQHYPQYSGQMSGGRQQNYNRDQYVIQQPNRIKVSIHGEGPNDGSGENVKGRKLPGKSDSPERLEQSGHIATPMSQQVQRNPFICFGLNSSIHREIQELFERLQSLLPMNKYGPMSGDCDLETTQMENFLIETFGFRNLHKKYIVQGVKAFELTRSLHSMPFNTEIRFPNSRSKGFTMTVEEIERWQRSYTVYADKNTPGMTKEFLLRALQGQSGFGEEAFRMKFVVRISQCSILMEFDAKIISREPHEKWPHNIKLVSVTGIDFAGRIHDVDDILTYLLNWRQIYEVDRKTGLPRVYHGRDFYLKPNAPQAELDEQLLLNDLRRMARLRLQACELEGVQIVVETGIGLGVFAGKYIGIDEKVRAFSAFAIRTVLERDGSNYKNIRAVVFALPIFGITRQDGQRQDTFHAFANEFSRYQGSVPVLIIDQDMHRLTVAIARQGYIVSELNPADSHGVFGEYWQNRGPAVEEKLALTTVGLLVQHHLINPYVRDQSHYHLI